MLKLLSTNREYTVRKLFDNLVPFLIENDLVTGGSDGHRFFYHDPRDLREVGYFHTCLTEYADKEEALNYIPVSKEAKQVALSRKFDRMEISASIIPGKIHAEICLL